MAEILIVDDEPLARSRLKRMIEALGTHSVCGEAENGEQALEQTLKLQPDIVFMDIRMPGLDGLEAARQIVQAENAPAIIFCTAYEDYAIEAFEVQAIGYLVKPVRKAALEKVLSQTTRLNRIQRKAVASLAGEPEPAEYFLAHTVKGELLIDVNRISYFKADQKYLTVFHDHGETLSDGTLKEIEQRYPERFLRIHRATLVNTDEIEALEKAADGSSLLVLKGGQSKLPVSRRHVPNVRAWLAKRSE